ncbi:ABC transporter permease subunit [Pseudoroseicyclus aestuarii]|uniref:Putative spermidine/putrescine transport system permease protein n=1 Tax=Pseudoroseicyclus aestuarii TaxID=1795041 RepID=A0A318SNF6_9RHOB|nr:ABC transporter permease subunit [Pseudoroseicyclus aestuarii]PYE81402.1 putative spermidine/putrescine transport system permease protein [Pseudoroseicyclus aestuarii]
MRALPPALLLAPALVVLAVLFGGGLVLTLAGSLGGWAPALAQARLPGAVLFSLWIAGASTALALALGCAAALLIRAGGRGTGLARALCQLVLTVPHAVGAVGLLYLVSQSGLLARGAAALGLIGGPADFPALTQDPLGLGIILHYTWKEAPFVALFALAALQGRGPGLEEAARSLGASPLRSFWHVTLPLLRPALLRAGAIAFAFAFGAWEVPQLLGGSRLLALPLLVWQRFTAADLAARPEALALAALTALISAGVAALLLRAAR